MREPTIARNYAQALFEVGERHDETERYANLMEGLAGAIEHEPAVHAVLASPRVTKPQKQAILTAALHKYASEPFLRFLQAVVKRGRQGILPAISREYLELVDQKFNRIHAGITLAREPDKALQEAVRTKLSEVIGKEVIPHFRADPAILGGLILRLNDRIIDGSLRRKMMNLKRQLLRT
ncbi:MAG: ATP synthase F1 subunit delta [Gemmatimonadota bacterium]|nr:MAG: ATP synthase F1 subunit delta [Gemmatimonadota bacterium]